MKVVIDGFLLRSEPLDLVWYVAATADLQEGAFEEKVAVCLDILQGECTVSAERGLVDLQPLVAEITVDSLHGHRACVLGQIARRLRAQVIGAGRAAAEARFDRLPNVALAVRCLGQHR